MEERRMKLKEFEELVKPIHAWLVENHNPHTMIIIDWDFAKVISEECGVPLETAY